MQATLALEDGRIFRGHGYGHPGECAGEVVFNTSLTGYQEIFTDPSYAGQIVVLTNPQIGNYGTNQADNESARPYIEGLIVREFSPISSNWRSEQVADEYMERYSVPVLAEIDTRALVRHLRTHGVMRGVISTAESNPDVLVAKARAIRKMDGTDLARVVSTKSIFTFDSADSRNQTGEPLLPTALDQEAEARKSLHVVAYDFGIKLNILRMLVREGCRVTVVPAETTRRGCLRPEARRRLPLQRSRRPRAGRLRRPRHSQIPGPRAGLWNLPGPSAHRPGPGRQAPTSSNSATTAATTRSETTLTGKVEITAHNHNFAVDPDSINANEVELTHVDLNDQTLEGLRHRTLPLFSVQYHPEAAPGPHDSNYLFRDFRRMMEEWKG